jgi:hypothetical protein
VPSLTLQEPPTPPAQLLAQLPALLPALLPEKVAWTASPDLQAASKAALVPVDSPISLAASKVAPVLTDSAISPAL